jgi:iron complex outermembrane receptor protein
MPATGFSSRALFIAVAALFAPSGHVFAADGEDALDVVIVTAQRRAEDQQTAPIAISSMSGDALAARRIRTIEDLGAYAPGLTTTNTVSYGAAPLTIRGIGGANGGGNFFNDEPVAVYVDGVYVARLSMSTADLLDIESIQILRGPQGTLYGRNSTARAYRKSRRSVARQHRSFW